MLGEENDKENAIVYINAGAGGTEAQDWAEMLLRMYLKWAEKKGFESEVVDLLAGDEAGVKNVAFLLQGSLCLRLHEVRERNTQAGAHLTF